MTMDGCCACTSASRTSPRPTTSSRRRRRRCAKATRSTPRTPACRRCGRSPISTGGSTTSSSIPAARSSSPPPGFRRCTWRSGRVLDPGDEAIVLSPAWPNGAAIIALSHACPSISARARRRAIRDRLRCARGGRHPRTRCRSTPRRRTRSGGSRPTRSSAGCSTLPRARPLADCGRGLRADLLPTASPAIPLPRSSAWRPARTRLRRAVVLQDLLHDRLARRLAGAAATWAGGRAAERVLRLARGDVHAKGREVALADGEDELRRMLARLRRIATSASPRCAPCPALPCRSLPARSTSSHDRRPDDSLAFCRRLLLEQRVGLAPGSPSAPEAKGR